MCRQMIVCLKFNMGSSPASPQLPIQVNQTQPVPKKQIEIETIKQETIQEPKKQLIVKVVPRQVAITIQLDESKLNILDQAKNSIKSEFKLRFLLKCHRKQIRAAFHESHNLQEKTQLRNMNHFQGNSEEILQKMFANDLSVYSEIFQLRLQDIINERLSKDHYKQLQEEQTFRKRVQQLLIQFRECMVGLLGQIEGKTSVWHSLSLTQSQITTNIINFCHQEGIDSSTFNFLPNGSQI